jgi:uncharacterized protein YndB with AHSA1/START domain
LFTAEVGAWWPPERRHTQDAASELFLLESGRFYERARDGREVELGKVIAWEAPARLVLEWYPGTDAEHPTEVEVKFVALPGDEARTRVEVVHRPTEASRDLFGTRAPRYDASWDLVLRALSRAVGGR